MSDSEEKARLLQFAATKAARDPFFLASAFETYKQKEHQSEADLATFLGVETATLVHLGLCRRPNTSNSKAFRTDVTKIAEKFGIDPAKLTALLRKVAAYESAITGHSNLMAARDRDEDEHE